MVLSLNGYLEKYSKDSSHAQEVRRLSMMIFDEVCEHIKDMSNKKRKFLEAAAMLHDVGYFIDCKSHNKHSQRLILENGIENFTPEETLIISCIARYHRGGLPNKKKDEIYSRLDKKKRKTVKRLAGILRIADGLDRAHYGLIKKVKIEFDKENTIVIFKLTPNMQEYRPDISYAIKKRNLFEDAFKCQSIFMFSEQ